MSELPELYHGMHPQLRVEAVRAIELARESVSANTRRAYASDWRGFSEWCEKHNLISLPASEQTIAVWVSHLVELEQALSTIRRKVSTIATMHKAHGHDSPAGELVRRIVRGYMRIRTERQRRAHAITLDQLRRIVDSIYRSQPNRAARDAAIILLGFMGALRASELSSVRWCDLTEVAEGYVIELTQTKTGSRTIPIASRSGPLCPVQAIKDWKTTLAQVRRVEPDDRLWVTVRRGDNIDTAPRSGLSSRTIAKIVKDRAREIGLVHLISSHSLRAGFATTAAKHGAQAMEIAKITGHASLDMVSRYVRHGSLFARHPSDLMPEE